MNMIMKLYIVLISLLRAFCVSDLARKKKEMPQEGGCN